MTHSLKFAMAAAGALLMTVPAQAATSLATWAYSDSSSTSKLLINGTTLLTASSRGWVDDGGNNNGGSAGANFIAGRCGSSDACSGSDNFYNNYFVFNLANFTGGTITSAVLQLSQGSQGYISPTPSLTYTLWDSSVAASAMPTTSSLAFYNDLSSGTSFGSVVVTAATNNSVVSFGLNAAGVSALNAAGRGLFGFGGTVNASANAVPESSTWLMMIAGFGIVGASLRYRRRKIAVSFG